VLPGVDIGTATKELPGVMTSEESPCASAIFKGFDIICTFIIRSSFSFYPGKIFNFVLGSGARNVSAGSHS
jgi:hypothetical protein